MKVFLKGFLVASMLFCTSALAYAPVKEVSSTNAQITDANGTCSGTVIEKTKKIILTAAHCTAITNPHVIMSSLDDKGNFVSKKEFVAHWVKKDEAKDVALLQVDDPSVEFVSQAKLSDNPKVGEDLYCVGMPFGMFTNYISKGIFANWQPPSGHWATKLIAMTCPTAGGMSGGAVYNDNGEQIGIVVGGLGAGSIPLTGYAFAVPIFEIRDFLKGI